MVKFMNKKTLWDDTISHKRIKRTDILIIGGGLTGCSLAYFLKDSKEKVMLIDKGRLGLGVTSKTTAKISYLQGIVYQTLEHIHGKEVSKSYFDAQKDAIEEITHIIEENHIACDLKKVGSVIFTCEDTGISKIKREKEILTSWGVDVKNVNHPCIKAGIKVFDTYIFHPLKYLQGLKEMIEDRVHIMEDVTAYNVKRERDYFWVQTTKGDIYAKKVAFACHYPFYIFPTLIPLKTYVQREYVNVSKWKAPRDFTAISIDDTLHSIRFYEDYIIYGSGGHRLTSKTDYAKNYEKSREDFQKYLGVPSEYTWMNQDVMSNDHLPFIGMIENGLYLATGYGAWGMTNGTIGAKLIADLIMHRNNPYAKLFDPKRNNLSLVTNSIVGSFHYLKSYMTSLFHRNNPYYIKIKGVMYGVYQDKEGSIHKIKLLCPHMKCNLVFNREEETWDCPCHGSRFDLDGHLIEGPATKDLRKID